MFFSQSQRIRQELAHDKLQRDPCAFLGQERMLLNWISVMAWVVSTSFAFSLSRSVPARVLQYFWFPFAAAGVMYSGWRYFARLYMMQSLRNQPTDKGMVADLQGPYFLVLLFCSVLTSLFIVFLWDSFQVTS